MAYQNDIPKGLAFYCQQPAVAGGESLLGDSRDVYRHISPHVRQEIEDRQLKFQRVLINQTFIQDRLSQKYSHFALLPSWQRNFATLDAELAENKARSSGHEVQWLKGGHMLISVIIKPTRLHPVTGEKMWVNNSHVFQLSKNVFGSRLYYLFKAFFALTRKPMTTCFFADGAKIPEAFTDDILNATHKSAVPLLLNRGDLILINNETIAHGRRPFIGQRRLYFAMYKEY